MQHHNRGWPFRGAATPPPGPAGRRGPPTASPARGGTPATGGCSRPPAAPPASQWQRGAERATRFRIATSPDGQDWLVGTGGLSSGRVTSAETYDLVDRRARYVRLTVLSAGQVERLTVRG